MSRSCASVCNVEKKKKNVMFRCQFYHGEHFSSEGARNLMMLMLISGSLPHPIHTTIHRKIIYRCLKHREEGEAQNFGGPGLAGHPVCVHAYVDVDLR